MGDRDHQPYLEPLLAEQVDYYRARRPVHLATRSGYEAVFFGFWLSHVPRERFECFWSLVGEALVPVARSSSSTTTTERPTS
jgi:hypothetical protein